MGGMVPLARYVRVRTQLYCCRLSDAVSTLEGQLRADPQRSTHPVLVSNLANLYQMSSSPAHEGAQAALTSSGITPKATLERLVIACGPDDFDLSVLNLGQ